MRRVLPYVLGAILGLLPALAMSLEAHASGNTTLPIPFTVGSGSCTDGGTTPGGAGTDTWTCTTAFSLSGDYGPSTNGVLTLSTSGVTGYVDASFASETCSGLRSGGTCAAAVAGGSDPGVTISSAVPATFTMSWVFNSAATPTPGGTGYCTWDGYCLGTLHASAASAADGTNVTLSETVDHDLGPSPYYLVIDGSDGSTHVSCSSGTTCSGPVSLPDPGGTVTYTAYLSFNCCPHDSGSVGSNSVSVTWSPSGSDTPTPGGATDTPGPSDTPGGATATPAVPTATAAISSTSPFTGAVTLYTADGQDVGAGFLVIFAWVAGPVVAILLIVTIRYIKLGSM